MTRYELNKKPGPRTHAEKWAPMEREKILMDSRNIIETAIRKGWAKRPDNRYYETVKN